MCVTIRTLSVAACVGFCAALIGAAGSAATLPDSQLCQMNWYVTGGGSLGFRCEGTCDGPTCWKTDPEPLGGGYESIECRCGTSGDPAGPCWAIVTRTTDGIYTALDCVMNGCQNTCNPTYDFDAPVEDPTSSTPACSCPD
jgi:hypothetical protein